ncbi:MAG: hypothetical protein IH623_08365 [Verrucomicrobia bacterium]|nr:hypothetical protein [Verrucomicrobiota bacterium]
MKANENRDQNPQQGWTALNARLDRRGRSETTGYRWRKCDWLETTINAGKHYLSVEQQRDFERRAAAGESATTPVTPSTPRLDSPPIVAK